MAWSPHIPHASRRRAHATHGASGSKPASHSAETRRRSGRNWSITTASLPGIRASSDLSAGCTALCRGRPAPSSRHRRERKRRSTTVHGPMMRDPNTGKYRRTRLFVLTLGYSRKSVRLLTFTSRGCIWAELHEQAFRRLGGSTRIVVCAGFPMSVWHDATGHPTA